MQRRCRKVTHNERACIVLTRREGFRPERNESTKRHKEMMNHNEIETSNKNKNKNRLKDSCFNLFLLTEYEKYASIFKQLS